jgi:flagella basal body P-ring formation protein FlgA
MIRRFSITAFLLAGGFACAAPSALEQQLRAQRPDVARWQIEPLGDAAAPDAAIARIGRLGPRTAVRYADGRVRWYRVAGFAPAVVSAHAAEAGVVIAAADAVSGETDVIGLGCDPLPKFEGAGRWRLTRRVAAGEALCTRDIEVAPDVERNAPVTLRAERGGVSVSRELTALTDARTGERVRLRDRASGATVLAIVTGPRSARLSEETR